MRHHSLSRRLLALSAGTVMVAGLAACGGDDGDEGEAGEGGGGTLVFGGRTWGIETHASRPGPDGETSGEVLMFLINA